MTSSGQIPNHFMQDLKKPSEGRFANGVQLT